MSVPQLLALDFDGVLCDGIEEYFQSTLRVYRQIWEGELSPLEESLKLSFARLRPVIETGWEMPVLLRAIVLGIEEASTGQDWAGVAKEIVSSEQLDWQELADRLDTVRDRWMKADLAEWLGLHRFYPGAIARLQKILAASTPQLYIITTKEGRFARQLLQQQGVELPPNAIIGKESKRPKHETLRQLLAIAAIQPDRLWFVEDRLKTLHSVRQQPDLQALQLYLADWGYNTPQMRDSARQNSKIRLLSLQQFGEDFRAWI